jgi:hypothetical protein
LYRGPVPLVISAHTSETSLEIRLVMAQTSGRRICKPSGEERHARSHQPKEEEA